VVPPGGVPHGPIGSGRRSDFFDPDFQQAFFDSSFTVPRESRLPLGLLPQGFKKKLGIERRERAEQPRALGRPAST